ncbi:putative multi-antimicrobial extrusion protein [Chloropicon primus]|uniref:Protein DETOXIFICATION n=1 Tax=Chloropicon primus TaxID=1764295 RepID=A0A5B8MHT8_9CHLO|nr:putative multi-antimicrobial extrusion protein [Chloropicon primus]UPQ98846.1 putative multi-antimicrobial extrusion protein [Chloropicon primus]|eukprot:QDZ19634.1 putative multi-antimicrobial extrusion protein [Chloropicon primus]
MTRATTARTTTARLASSRGGAVLRRRSSSTVLPHRRKVTASRRAAPEEVEYEYEPQREAPPLGDNSNNKVQLEAEVVSEPGLVLDNSPQQAVELDSAADIAVGDGAAPAYDAVHSEAKYVEIQKGHQEEPDVFGVVRPQQVFDLEVLSEDAAAEVVIPSGETEAEVVLQEAAAPLVGEPEPASLDTLLSPKPSRMTLQQVLAFSIPALAGIMTDPLMSFVDTACVGRMSSTELAAMGPNTAIYNFVLQIFTCFIVYTCSMVSKLSSKAEHDKVFELVSHALFLGVATGVLVAAGLIGFSTPLLASMDTLPELMAPAASYLKIRALSMPAVLVCMVSGAFCLGRKDSKTPLLVAIASTITNLLGDIVLIFGPAKMGITGAALATAASVYVGAAYFLWKVGSQIPLRLSVPGLKDIKPFLTTSSMLTIRNCSIMFNFVAMTMFAGTYGAVATACHQVAISVFMIGNLAAEPFSQCAQSFLASIGSLKRRSQEEHAYLVGAMKLLTVTTFVCGAAMCLFTGGMCSIPALFTTDAVIGTKVGLAAPIVGVAVWLSCVNCVSDGFIFANQDYNYGALLAVLNIPVLLFILQTAGKLGFGWVSVWIGMAAFYAIRLTENTVRILYLNKKRLAAKEA